MNLRSSILIFAALFWGMTESYAQKLHGPAIRPIEFLVRNGDYIKNIAARIKVPAKEIIKANKLHSKNFLAYPGMKIILPVRVQPKVWDPTREDMSGSSPSREDRGGSDDYELVIDSTNYRLSEDFINLKDARDDSLEYENIAEHLRRIDKKIPYLYHKIDSVKQVDFKFDYEEQDKSSALGKVKMSRDKFYAEGPLGRQIDSLQEMKVWLGQRRVILRNQVTEYEYLVENAGYSEHNFKHDEKDRPDTWGDHLAYEIQYMKDKAAAAAKANNTKPQPSAENTSKTTAQVKKTETPSEAQNPVNIKPEKSKENTTATDDLVKNESISYAKTETPAPKTDYDKMKLLENDDINFMDTLSDVGYVEHHYKSDFAAVPRQKFTTEIDVLSAPRGLSTTGANATTVYHARQAALFEEMPKADKEPNEEIENKALQAHDKIVIEEATKTASTLSASEEPAIKMNIKPDTTSERKIKKVDADPLAKYKSEDSGFVSKTQIKGIPIAEYKNKPKYLVPVDSVTRIKGDFFVIRARQALEKGDFKDGDKYLRKSLDINPNNAQAWMLHADLFLAMGLADQSLKEYLISSEIDSTNPKIFYNIALLYTKAHNSQRAYKYFTRAIEVSDKYLLAYMGRASLQMDEHDFDGAIQDYDKVLAANKYYSPAFKARGLAKMELRKFGDAVADFNQYLEIEDPDGYVIYQRGISKIYNNSLLQGCLDLSSSQELGFKEAEKAIKKFCE